VIAPVWRRLALAVVPVVYTAAAGGCYGGGARQATAGDDAGAPPDDASSPNEGSTLEGGGDGAADGADDVPVQIICPPAPPVDLNAVPGLAEKCARVVYVAGGDNGQEIAVSFDDGAHWQTQFADPKAGRTDNIVFGLGYGFAVGTDDSLITTNATSWMPTDGRPPTSGFGAAFAFVNGMFVYVATRNGSGYSFDGTDWQFFHNGDPYSTGAMADFYGLQIAYGNGIYVAAGPSSLGTAAYRTSTDGENWSNDIQIGPGYHGFLTSVAFGAGEFVVVGTSNGDNTSPNAEGLIAWSSDAKSWTVVNNENPSPLGQMHFSEVARSDTLFVAVNNQYSPRGQWWSADGIHWTANPMGPNAGHLSAFENHFIGGPVGGQPGAVVVVSDDGKTWTQQVAFTDMGVSVSSVGIGRVLKGM
jgi:hypothetical protein